ncbi:MAG TPA: DUF433 domain-containing protein [Chloroflexi bacterium]|nr:DUF433 domain-containing protein [Chloroflexota bacterium]
MGEQQVDLPVREGVAFDGERPVFETAKVPLYTILQYFLDGLTIEDFLSDYPTIDRASLERGIAYIILQLGYQPEVPEEFHW